MRHGGSLHPEAIPVARSARALEEHLGPAPPTAVVLGSGLSRVIDAVRRTGTVQYADVGLPGPTVEGHTGVAITGELGGEGVVLMAGRVHLYEGWSAQELVRGVRALAEWGVKRLVLTCAAGTIAPLPVGSLALITDHIGLQHDNPLRGVPWGGVRFPDLTWAYDPRLCKALRAAASDIGLPLGEGVYAAMNGPAYETPAEIRMLRSMGADLVGMSTVPEVLASAQLGLPCAAVAMVSNAAAGLGDTGLSHEDVAEAAAAAAGSLANLLAAALPRF